MLRYFVIKTINTLFHVSLKWFWTNFSTKNFPLLALVYRKKVEKKKNVGLHKSCQFFAVSASPKVLFLFCFLEVKDIKASSLNDL